MDQRTPNITNEKKKIADIFPTNNNEHITIGVLHSVSLQTKRAEFKPYARIHIWASR